MMLRRALLALPAACLSCALFVSFGDYDVDPAYVLSEGGGGAESSTVGFRLSAVPSALSVARDKSAPVTVRIVRDPGFVAPIGFDAPSISGAGLSASDGGVTADELVIDVTGTVGATSSKITFRAHAADRTQSLDVPVEVRPSSGDVDPAFGDGGVTLMEDAVPFGVARDPSGRVAVAVVRTVPGAVDQVVHGFTPAGLLDPTFGDAGTTLLDHYVTSLDPPPTPGVLVTTPSGLVATSDHVIRRLSATGKADPTFADAGALGSSIFLPLVATDGAKLVALGPDVTTDENFATRVLAGGPPDTTFADAGVLDLGAYSMGTHVVRCGRVVSGQLVVLVNSQAAVGAPVPYLLRFSQSGALDTTYGDAGRHALPPTEMLDCDIGPDGGVTGGYGTRAVASGPLGDITFAPMGFDSVLRVAWDPSGRIVAVGGHDMLLFVARYLPDGTPDKTFRRGALPFGVSLPLDARDVRALVDADGSILLAARDGATKSLTILRLLP